MVFRLLQLHRVLYDQRGMLWRRRHQLHKRWSSEPQQRGKTCSAWFNIFVILICSIYYIIFMWYIVMYVHILWDIHLCKKLENVMCYVCSQYLCMKLEDCDSICGVILYVIVGCDVQYSVICEFCNLGGKFEI